jgi:cysteinyl-tRNA synthetase
MDINIQDKHYNKYLKYKLKYLELKKQSGGELDNILAKLAEFTSQKTNNYTKISNMEYYFNNDLVKDLKIFNKYDHDILNKTGKIVINNTTWGNVIDPRKTKEKNLEKLNENIQIIFNFIDNNLKTIQKVDILKKLINEYLFTYKAYINNNYK